MAASGSRTGTRVSARDGRRPARARPGVRRSPARRAAAGAARIRPTAASASPVGDGSGANARSAQVGVRQRRAPAGRSRAAASTSTLGRRGRGRAQRRRPRDGGQQRGEQPTADEDGAAYGAERRGRAGHGACPDGRSRPGPARRRSPQGVSRTVAATSSLEARRAVGRLVAARATRRLGVGRRGGLRRTTRTSDRGRRLRTSTPARGAAVGAVEARALEHHAHGVEQLAQPAVALGADGQRVVAEALELLEGVAALGAGVLVGRHGSSAAAPGPGRHGARRWHSTPSTANGTAQWPAP